MSSTNVIQPARAASLPKQYIGPILISSILFAAHISFGILDSYTKLLTAIAATVVTELVLHRFMTGAWRHLSSAYVSGISAGILVRSPLFWPFALTGAISIASKYVFRYRGSHIWNPTNFGIVVMLLIASDHMAVLSIQWGNNMWAMALIWLVGLFTIYKVNRFHICAAYILSFVSFAFLRSLITGDLFLAEIAPLTGPMYQLFVLFMITDPKTTLPNKRAQIFVAVSIAFVEMLFRLGEAVYAPFYGLFLVGPISIFIWHWLQDRKAKDVKGSAKVSEDV